MYENWTAENHPWMRYFTICGIITGIFGFISPLSPCWALTGLTEISKGQNQSTIGLTITMTLMVFACLSMMWLVPLFGGIYVLNKTKWYRQWNQSERFTKIIAIWCIVTGGFLGFIPLSIPFLILGFLFPPTFWWLPWKN